MILDDLSKKSKTSIIKLLEQAYIDNAYYADELDKYKKVFEDSCDKLAKDIDTCFYDKDAEKCSKCDLTLKKVSKCFQEYFLNGYLKEIGYA